MSGKVIEARGIIKSYKSLLGKRSTVLRDISLEVDGDEIFGILGPNGSGKTTLISIFSTLIYPDQGELRVLGLDAGKNRDQIRKMINISTAKPNFPWSLNVKENLRYSGMLYGMYGSKLDKAVEDAIDAFELHEYRHTKFEDLSTGLKQRLSLSKAMLNNPKLLFLDEPTTGLDPEIAIKTRSIILRIHEEQGVSIVMSTHYMPEAEVLCDRIAFLRHGQVVALDTPQNLKNQLQLGERMTIAYDGQVDLSGIRSIPGVQMVSASDGNVEIIIDRTDENVGKIIKLFSDANISDIKIKEPDLEDVFIELAR